MHLKFDDSDWSESRSKERHEFLLRKNVHVYICPKKEGIKIKVKNGGFLVLYRLPKATLSYSV